MKDTHESDGALTVTPVLARLLREAETVTEAEVAAYAEETMFPVYEGEHVLAEHIPFELMRFFALAFRKQKQAFELQDKAQTAADSGEQEKAQALADEGFQLETEKKCLLAMGWFELDIQACVWRAPDHASRWIRRGYKLVLSPYEKGIPPIRDPSITLH